MARLTSQTESFVRSIQVPEKTRTYTPVSHGSVIDLVKESLKNKGLEIRSTDYRTTQNGNALQGIYHINHSTDNEMGMMFAFANSYDKTMRFKCAIGGYVFVCSNGMLRGDMATYNRKHSKNADEDIFLELEQQMLIADNRYKETVATKDIMKEIIISPLDARAIVSELFFEHDMLTTEQISIIKNEFKSPSFDYNCDKDALWTTYQHITHSLKTTHPRDYMSNQIGVFNHLDKLYNFDSKKTTEVILAV